MKLADFGTAVELSQIAAVGRKLVGCTPYFAAPEVSESLLLISLLSTGDTGC